MGRNGIMVQRDTGRFVRRYGVVSLVVLRFFFCDVFDLCKFCMDGILRVCELLNVFFYWILIFLNKFEYLNNVKFFMLIKNMKCLRDVSEDIIILVNVMKI